MYDNTEYLNLTYPPDLRPEDRFSFVTDTARVLQQAPSVALSVSEHTTEPPGTAATAA